MNCEKRDEQMSIQMNYMLGEIGGCYKGCLEANSRCYCNKTPSMAGQKSGLLLPALHPGNQQSCFQKSSVI